MTSLVILSVDKLREKVRGFLDIEIAVEKILSRFKERGYGCMFTFEELQEWLGVKVEYDKIIDEYQDPIEREKELTRVGLTMLAICNELNDHLEDEHSISLEVDENAQFFMVVEPVHTGEYGEEWFDELHHVNDEEFRESIVMFMKDVWEKVSYMYPMLKRLQLITLGNWIKTMPLFAINNLDFNFEPIERICKHKSEAAQSLLTRTCMSYGVDVDDFLEIVKEVSLSGKDLADVIPFPKKPKERGD